MSAINFLILKLFLVILIARPVSAAVYDHSLWDQLLKTHVSITHHGHTTVVDYQGMSGDHDRLIRYLEGLSVVKKQQFDQWPLPQQLAFLINAYNAWTVELILSRWPELTSIKDVGGWFTSPWKKQFIPLLEQRRSLDDIEHILIRQGPYQEPRIHFAVNCASIGCPALRTEAYTGERLAAQLEAQTRQFLSDQSRNRVEKNHIYLSAIFKWYREDFEQGWGGFHRLESFLLAYADVLDLSPEIRRQLETGNADIEYLDYDWRLNRIP